MPPPPLGPPKRDDDDDDDDDDDEDMWIRVDISQTRFSVCRTKSARRARTSSSRDPFFSPRSSSNARSRFDFVLLRLRRLHSLHLHPEHLLHLRGLLAFRGDHLDELLHVVAPGSPCACNVTPSAGDFSTKYPVPTSSRTLSTSPSLPGTYSELVKASISLPSVSASIASSARPEVVRATAFCGLASDSVSWLTSDSSCSERPCAKMRRDSGRVARRVGRERRGQSQKREAGGAVAGVRDRAATLGSRRGVSPGRHRERRSRSARREITSGRLFKRSARSRGGTARAPATAGARATRAACRLDCAISAVGSLGLAEVWRATREGWVKRNSQPKKRDGRYHAHESRQKSVCACFLPPISRRARRTARARLRATTRRRSCAGIETRVRFWRFTRVFSWRGFRARSSASPRTDRAAPRSRTAQA